MCQDKAVAWLTCISALSEYVDACHAYFKKPLATQIRIFGEAHNHIAGEKKTDESA